jgi:hypothetical protein
MSMLPILKGCYSQPQAQTGGQTSRGRAQAALGCWWTHQGLYWASSSHSGISLFS